MVFFSFLSIELVAIWMVKFENRIFKFADSVKLMDLTKKMFTMLTVTVHIPDDHFWFEIAKITSQMRADTSTTTSDQYHLPRHILKQLEKLYLFNILQVES